MPYRVRRIQQKEEPNSLKHWKYVKRWREKGKWRYLYPDDIGKNGVAGSPSNTVKTQKTTSPLLRPDSVVLDKSDQKIEELVKNLYEKSIPTVDETKEESDSAKAIINDLKETIDWQKEVMSSMESNYESLSDLPLKDGEWSRSEDSEVINPNYFKGETFEELLATTTNCTYCTMAYDMRRRGYDVQALEEPACLTAYGISQVYDLELDDITWASELLRGYKDENTGDEDESLINWYEHDAFEYDESDANELTSLLEAEMLECGEGARGQFLVWWWGGGAHSMTWEVENGKVVIRDSQDNTTSSVLEYVERCCNVAYIRTDNLTPTEEILKFIKAREG